MDKDKTIDRLLGALSIEEKIAQMMVLGVPGLVVDPLMTEFIGKYGIGGLRLSAHANRKFVRYMHKGSCAEKNVTRAPQWREKIMDNTIQSRRVCAGEYSVFLNSLRRKTFEQRGLPVHMVADFEFGGGDFTPPGMISLPAPMGFGHLGDLDLIKRAANASASQIKAVGIDWIHSPVVDVNVNPYNPEIYYRSYHETAPVVSACAKAALDGFKNANLIGTLKHFPGRGASSEDAHFGLTEISAGKREMDEIHLKPYRDLIQSGHAQSIMLAHTIYPGLDPTREIATVSDYIIRELLREELNFQGVITTDSLTMGGLMERYSVSQSCIMAVNSGVDILLLKDENSLRFELHADLVNAVRQGVIAEDKINASLKRIWSLKWDYGLFENGGVVAPEKADLAMRNDKFHSVSREASARAIRILRDEDKLLPLRPEQNVLVIDRLTFAQTSRNDSWNYPGMLWDFMRRHSENIGYIDYTPQTADKIGETINQIINHVDIIVVTANFDRNDEGHNDKDFVRSLKKYGKPIIMISSNPYRELLIPDEIGSVIVTYGLMREQLEAAAQVLYLKK